MSELRSFSQDELKEINEYIHSPQFHAKKYPESMTNIEIVMDVATQMQYKLNPKEKK